MMTVCAEGNHFLKAHIEHTVSRTAKKYSILQMKGFTMETVFRCPVRVVYQHPLISNQWSTIRNMYIVWTVCGTKQVSIQLPLVKSKSLGPNFSLFYL